MIGVGKGDGSADDLFAGRKLLFDSVENSRLGGAVLRVDGSR
jgi:hypothetical protein